MTNPTLVYAPLSEDEKTHSKYIIYLEPKSSDILRSIKYFVTVSINNIGRQTQELAISNLKILPNICLDYFLSGFY